MFSQLDRVVLHTNTDDSIRHYESMGDFKSANQFIQNRLHELNENSADLEFDLSVKLFSNQLSLRENEVAMQTSNRIDSLVAHQDITNFDAETLGLYYHKRGVLYFRLDDTEKSIQSYKKAIEYRVSTTSESNLAVIKSLRNLGLAYYYNGEFKNAAKAYTRSIDNHLLRSDRDESMLQSTYSFLSNTYFKMNDLEKGWQFLQSSIALAEGLFGNESVRMAEIYSSDVFEYYARINDTDEMLNACMMSESILSKLDQNGPEVQAKLSNTYNNYAIAYERNGDVNSAENYYLRSSLINSVNPNRIYHLIHNYLNLGSLLMDSNQFKKASSYFNYVKDLLSPELDSIIHGRYYYHMAELNRLEENYDRSEFNFIKSLTYFNAYNNSNLESIKNGLPSYIEILFDYAQLFDDQYLQSDNISYLYRYDSIYTKIDIGIQAMRKDFNSQESKLFLSSEVKEIYEDAINIYYILFEKTRNTVFKEHCFEIIEKNKSLAILEELQNRQLLTDAQLPAKLLAQIDALEREKQQLNLQKQIDPEIKDVIEKLIQTDLALDKVFSDISNSHPQYERQKFNSESIQLSDAQKLTANENVAAIQYFLTADYLYLMYIDGNVSQLKRFDVESSFISDIATLRRVINESTDKVQFNYKERLELTSDLLLTSRKLYKQLILPFESQLETAQGLVIIPDKQIGYIPFDILSSTGEPDDYLIHQYNISYAYSMGLYEWMVNTIHESEVDKIYGFAPSFTGSNSLASLPFNQTEIEKISEVFAIDSNVGVHASKDKFLDSYAEYSMIHLSTHGIVDHTNPSRSYIAFSEVSDSSKLQHSLYANEIFNLNSKAELLVLSACETAIGGIAEGEGVMSLSRAWAATGVKSIVSTLWRIDDQFTSEFMMEFYKRMKNGESKSVAVWNTKKRFINDEVYQQPYYWASFTLMGDRASLNVNGHANFMTMIYIGLGAFVMLFLFYLFFKRVF